MSVCILFFYIKCTKNIFLFNEKNKFFNVKSHTKSLLLLILLFFPKYNNLLNKQLNLSICQYNKKKEAMNNFCCKFIIVQMFLDYR